MEKKEVSRSKHTFWPILGFGNIVRSILGRKYFSKNNVSAFTLIELLVVIAIVGVLAGGVIVVMNPAAQIAKARDAQRKSDLKQIQDALEVYYNDYKNYPAATSSKIMGIAWGNAWTGYMGALPKDPSSSKNYVYVSSGGQTYYLYASLDRGANDPQACNSGSACANAGSANCGSGATCNYGVSSPNVSP